MLAYAASRSLSFIQNTLGEGNQILGYFALLATSGGMLGWLAVFLWKADGIIQRGIALLMVLIDFFGEAALFTMDTLYESGKNGMISAMTPEEIRSVVIGMSALIAVNIFATVMFELCNMEVIKNIVEMAQRDTLFLKARRAAGANAKEANFFLEKKVIFLLYTCAIVNQRLST